MDLTRESFDSVRALLTEKRGEMATKRQINPSGVSESDSSTTVCNPVKRRVTFPSASRNEKETQTETATTSNAFEGI